MDFFQDLFDNIAMPDFDVNPQPGLMDFFHGLVQVLSQGCIGFHEVFPMLMDLVSDRVIQVNRFDDVQQRKVRSGPLC